MKVNCEQTILKDFATHGIIIHNLTILRMGLKEV